MLKAILIDDEPLGIDSLKNLILTYCPEIEIIASSQEIEEGIQLLNSLDFDLLFLDVELRTGTGFDVLKAVPGRKFEVIFTTAHESYAIRAFKYSAVDYLLKPINYQELKAAVKRAMEKRKISKENNRLSFLIDNLHNKENTKITLSTTESYHFVDVGDIVYCQAEAAYTRFYLKKGKEILVSKHLGEYAKLLQNEFFFRPHQSYLINIHAVEKFVKQDGGYIQLNTGVQIPLSRNKKEEFLKAMSKK